MQLFRRGLSANSDPSADYDHRLLAHKIRKAKTFGQICALHGYMHEEHVVTTEDGYLLLLHRILPKENASKSAQTSGLQKPVVYLQHGLLTNSELFMCIADPAKCLPLVLIERGYDIWLGNNRGNKYSRNHTHKSVNCPEFWDFCIDDFARYDIPCSIDFVLNFTGSTKLSYIGFSQGTAQAFAALSIYPELNDKIDIFVALAPIMHPAGFSSSLIDSAVKSNPSLFFRFFGRKSMFPSVAMWQSILPTFFLHKCIDIALIPLLGCSNHNITKTQKIAAYSHIYCSSSVKVVVHWGQIMRTSVFGTYDDGMPATTRYPTENIKTPIVLIYGDQDSLFDIDPALEHLPAGVACERLRSYEHIDVLWGGNVHVDVIPKVLAALTP
ncbi:Alpha/Beta hydrolase protein [Flammula alnicola]|nr:Alpha/Beta hydrolase protein [Flammula alnicola]